MVLRLQFHRKAARFGTKLTVVSSSLCQYQMKGKVTCHDFCITVTRVHLAVVFGCKIALVDCRINRVVNARINFNLVKPPSKSTIPQHSGSHGRPVDQILETPGVREVFVLCTRA